MTLKLKHSRYFRPCPYQCCHADQTYALMLSISCMQQILDHMNESGVYSESDLAPFHRRLTDLR